MSMLVLFFEFTNTGEKPLVITKIDVSCGCIETDYVKTPIMKGESSKIKSCFESK